MRTEVTREQARDMAEAHAEGLHSENSRQFCPECEGRELSSYPPADSLRLKSVQEIRDKLAAERKSLAALAPHNGTVPGARAIASCRANIEALEAELAARED